MADFQQAIKWTKEGKRVRRNNQIKEVYYELIEDDLIVKYNQGRDVIFDLRDFEATDWEIYEEDDDWELGEQMSNLNDVVGFSLFDTHKFIQKLKEDIKESYTEGNTDLMINVESVFEIIDKRAGNLK